MGLVEKLRKFVWVLNELIKGVRRKGNHNNSSRALIWGEMGDCVIMESLGKGVGTIVHLWLNGVQYCGGMVMIPYFGSNEQVFQSFWWATELPSC